MVIFFFLIIIGLTISYFANKTQNKFYVWLLVLLLSVFSGFRGETVGVDTPLYYLHISSGFPHPWQFREEGFRFISNIIMDLSNNPQNVFIFCAFVTNLLIIFRMWDFRKKANFTMMCFVYLLIFYPNTMNIMRQMVSVAIVFYGTRFLEKKHYLIFLCFIYAAFLFHRSSILSVGFLFLTIWNKLSKKQKVFLIIPFVFVFIVMLMYLRNSLSSDISSYSTQIVSNINLTYFYRLFIAVFAIICNWFNCRILISENIRPKKNNYLFDKNNMIFYLVGILFSGLSMFFSFVGRSGLYYLIFETVFWGVSIKQSKNGFLFFWLISIYAVYVFFQMIITNSLGLFPFYMYLY